MILLTNVPLLDIAIHIFRVRLIGRMQVNFDRNVCCSGHRLYAV